MPIAASASGRAASISPRVTNASARFARIPASPTRLPIERAVFRRESAQGDCEIRQGGAGRRIGLGRSDIGNLDLDHPVASLAALATEDLAGLVRGDRHQPRPQALGFAQGTELAPGDRPGGLDRILGRVLIATDDVADPGHVVVVGAHDAGEGIGVTGRGVGDGRRHDASGDRQLTHHAP
jgi:hypothetical protein